MIKKSNYLFGDQNCRGRIQKNKKNNINETFWSICTKFCICALYELMKILNYVKLVETQKGTKNIKKKKKKKKKSKKTDISNWIVS